MHIINRLKGYDPQAIPQDWTDVVWSYESTTLPSFLSSYDLPILIVTRADGSCFHYRGLHEWQADDGSEGAYAPSRGMVESMRLFWREDERNVVDATIKELLEEDKGNSRGLGSLSTDIQKLCSC